MAIIGGMDSGFGSQVKIIRTNFLVTKTSATLTNDTGLSNMLNLVNHRIPSNMQCDYLMIDDQAATVTGITSRNILLYLGSGDAALMGPSTSSLAQASGLESHANTLDKLHDHTNGIVHMLTSLSAVKITANAAGDNFDEFTFLPLAVNSAGDQSKVEQTNSAMLRDQLDTGTASLPSLANPLGIVNNAGISTIDYTDAALNNDFIAQGNTAGVTPTTFTSLGAIIDNKVFGILSATAIIQTAQ